MWHGDKEVASEPRTVLPCFSLYNTGRTVTTLYTPSVPHGPQGSSVQLGAGRLHYRRVCSCVAHDKQRGSSFTTSWYLSCGSIVSIVVLWRSKSGLRSLYSYSSRNRSRYSPLLSLASPPRPRFCAEDLSKPAGAHSEEDNLLHATKPKKVDLLCVVSFLCHLRWNSRV